MTTYYRLDDKGEIDWKSTEPRVYLPLRTEEEIVEGHDGKLYFASQCPEPPAPGPEARRAEIMARLNALAELLPKQYTVVNAMCGDAEAQAIVAEKRAAHEAAAGPLRAELRGLEEAEEGEAE